MLKTLAMFISLYNTNLADLFQQQGNILVVLPRCFFLLSFFRFGNSIRTLHVLSREQRAIRFLVHRLKIPVT